MEKLSLPLYELAEVEILGQTYKLRPRNLPLIRKVRQVIKESEAGDASGDDFAFIEAAYSLAKLYINAPAEVIDELPLEQVKEISAFVSGLFAGLKKKPGGEAAAAAGNKPPEAGAAGVEVEDPEKNGPKPGDGPAA